MNHAFSFAKRSAGRFCPATLSHNVPRAPRARHVQPHRRLAHLALRYAAALGPSVAGTPPRAEPFQQSSEGARPRTAVLVAYSWFPSKPQAYSIKAICPAGSGATQPPGMFENKFTYSSSSRESVEPLLRLRAALR